jgi:hypothetical protein
LLAEAQASAAEIAAAAAEEAEVQTSSGDDQNAADVDGRDPESVPPAVSLGADGEEKGEA